MAQRRSFLYVRIDLAVQMVGPTDDPQVGLNSCQNGGHVKAGAARLRQPLFHVPISAGSIKTARKTLQEATRRYLPQDELTDGQVDDRKISKLCEYAAKNPLRIPQITEYLEQRCYKELRNEHVGEAKVIICIYRKMLASCKDQMPLYASSLLCIVKTLLDQTRQDEMRILGCQALIDFINCQADHQVLLVGHEDTTTANQVLLVGHEDTTTASCLCVKEGAELCMPMDSTYMFNLEGLLPKVCHLANEVGEEERELRLRSAGLQAIASMVWFMGEYSHISMDINDVKKVLIDEDNGSSFTGNQKSAPSQQETVPSDQTIDTSKCPTYWSKICLQNMAALAKEAATARRILEPLFHNFDSENRWSVEKGLAFPALCSMLLLMEKSGENTQPLLSMLVKHLDHKNIVKNPSAQIDILKVTSHLAQHSKLRASVTMISAVSDLMRHLRKCMQTSLESEAGDDVDEWNGALHSALEQCIFQLSSKHDETIVKFHDTWVWFYFFESHVFYLWHTSSSEGSEA
ncbi:hypothetical protein ACLOJK_009024 [Asimina triloba]